SKRQKRLFTQMRLFSDLYLGGFARQHPDRNLQTLLGCVNDADRSIAPLGPAKDLQDSTVKGVKGVEDLNIRISRAQGIGGVGVRIFPGTAWSPPVGSPRIVPVGSAPLAHDSFCPGRSSPRCFGASSWLCSAAPIAEINSASAARSRLGSGRARSIDSSDNSKE